MCELAKQQNNQTQTNETSNRVFLWGHLTALCLGPPCVSWAPAEAHVPCLLLLARLPTSDLPLGPGLFLPSFMLGGWLSLIPLFIHTEYLFSTSHVPRKVND